MHQDMFWPPSLRVRLLLLVIFSALSVWETRLSMVACFLTLIALVSRAASGAASSSRFLVWGSISLSGLLALVGFFRFVTLEAIPGVIAGGRAAAEKHAVAYLRTIVTAEDYMRRGAHIDPDGDGIGSAGSLAELSGRVMLRTGQPAAQSPLSVSAEEWFAHSGFVGSGAYIFRICLPAKSGWVNTPTTDEWTIGLRVDDERAEREYLVYGWPRTASPGAPTQIYVSDAYERIMVMDADGSNGQHPYVGEGAPPPCSLLAETNAFQAWKGKTARATLPGDGDVAGPKVLPAVQP